MPRTLPNLRLRIRPESQSRSSPSANQKYDQDTGQIFYEKTAPIQCSDDSNWCLCFLSGVEEEKGDIKGWRQPSRSSQGVNSQRSEFSSGTTTLLEMTVKSAVDNITYLTLQIVQFLPIRLVRQIWRALLKRGPTSFHTWTIFSKILHADEAVDLDLLLYHGAISKPMSRLSDFSIPLTSESFNFIAALTVTTIFPLSSLISLVKMRNLGVLELINGDATSHPANGVGDRLIRDWHLAAVNDGAFPVLRILRLIMHEGITGESLAFINGFPALALYDVRGCHIAHKYSAAAEKLGWTAIDEESPLYELEKLCLKRTVAKDDSIGTRTRMYHEMYSHSLLGRAEVRSMPREQVLQFLAQTRTTMSKLPAEENAESKITKTTPDRRGDFYQTTLFYGRNDATNESTTNTWELSTYRTFNRIGELRADFDMAKAGISIGDQAVVGQELISFIPYASLRLGPNPNSLERSRYVFRLAFIRVNMPSSETQKNNSTSNQAPGTSDGAGKKRGSSKYGSSRATQRPGPAVMNSRKRKLDDVLGSFT